jgi:hypothetical protein
MISTQLLNLRKLNTMRFKKLIFIFQILAILALPDITYASLYITNNTIEWISGFFGSAANCSSSTIGDPGLIKPMTINNMIRASDVRDYLCNNETPCKALIISSKDWQSAQTCNGHIIGEIEIDDLTTDIITKITIMDSNYTITGAGANYIIISTK